MVLQKIFKKGDKKLTAVLIDLRVTDDFDILDFESIFELFDYLSMKDIKTLKFYNYEPKEGRVIITFPIKLSPKSEPSM